MEAEIKRGPGRPRKYDEESGKKVLVRFTNLESPGTPLEFSWRGKIFKGETAFHDGNIYEIPVELMKHVNKTMRPEPTPIVENGVVVGTKWAKRQRFAFNEVDPSELDE